MTQPTVLIIEDNRDLARAMAGLLRLAGFNAVCALNGAKSLESMRIHLPALVILDLNLGNCSGLDLLEEMRCSVDLAHVPVVIYTALDERPLRDRARKLGAIDYCVKGVLDGDTLLRMVWKHLTRAGAMVGPSPDRTAAGTTLS